MCTCDRFPLLPHPQRPPIKMAKNSHLAPNKSITTLIFISCFFHYSIAVAFVASVATAADCAKRLIFVSGFSFFFHQSMNKYQSTTKSVFNEAGAPVCLYRGKQHFVFFLFVSFISAQSCSNVHAHRSSIHTRPLDDH